MWQTAKDKPLKELAVECYFYDKQYSGLWYGFTFNQLPQNIQNLYFEEAKFLQKGA